MLNSPIEEEDRVGLSLQLRHPVTNFCPPASGISRGCRLWVACQLLAGDLVVDQGHQDQDCDIYQVNLRGIIGACMLTIIVNSMEEIKCLLNHLLCINAQ